MSNSKIETFDVMGWPLARVGGGEEARIHDLELGRRAGLSRPRDIRKTIHGLIRRGRLPNIWKREVRARTPFSEANLEFWANKHEALVIVNELETLIRRLVSDGLFNESELFATVERSGGRPAKEYLLTEDQAVLVTTQSKRLRIATSDTM